MIYIILVNWNGINDTLACLDSLLKLNCDNFSIVVCDNGSSDNSSLKIQEWFCSLENEQRNKCNLHKVSEKQLDKKFDKNKNLNIFFIDIGKNLGFSGGNNVGIKFSLSQGDMDYVWLLNNDTVVDSNSLSIMKSAFSRNENIGICGSRLVYFDARDTIQGLGGVFYPILCMAKHYKAYEPADMQFNDDLVSDQIDYIIGASMLISKNVLDDIGGLCEDYFLYFEEIDFCLRAKNAGYKIFVTTESIVYHKEGASTKKNSKGIVSDFYWVRNRLLVAKKFYPYYYVPVYLSLLIALVNRIRRKEYHKAMNVINVMLNKNMKV
ncbi:glycosyltransferase family 2 protein [Klebsiella pneumoniae]|uniref:glycosyltransferase family 2 protein n=1 Tax=Klebsiella pneumoniae TaxID=573 RepID=UPI00388D2D66